MRPRAAAQRLVPRLAHAGHGTVEVHVADLADPGGLRSAEDKIAASPNLELLVNNAGFAGYGSFTGLDPTLATALIGVHVTAPTPLTRAGLPAMVGRSRGQHDASRATIKSINEGRSLMARSSS